MSRALINQRKTPAKRAFTGMAGSPLARVDDSFTPPDLSLVIPVKPGPKPINDRAMTPAERKARQRNKEAIEEVLKISDTHGRLHNERSGEAPRQGGQSEMERIVAAQERDEHGKRNKPEGKAPDRFEVDKTADPADLAEPFDRNATRQYVRNRLDEELRAKKLDDKIAAIAVWMFKEPWPGCCRCCGIEIASAVDRENHVWEAVVKGQRQRDYFETLRELEAPENLLDEACRRIKEDRHLLTIESLLRSRKLFRNP